MKLHALEKNQTELIDTAPSKIHRILGIGLKLA